MEKLEEGQLVKNIMGSEVKGGERIKEIVKFTTENEALRKTQGFAKQEIKDEVIDSVNNKVKTWKEEKENYKISFKKIFEQDGK